MPSYRMTVDKALAEPTEKPSTHPFNELVIQMLFVVNHINIITSPCALAKFLKVILQSPKFGSPVALDIP